MRPWLLTLIQSLFAITLCTGVWWIYHPAALILAGVIGVYACERAAPSEQVK